MQKRIFETFKKQDFIKILEVIRWPGERDSNPRRCDPQRFSRPPLSTAQPSPDNWRRHSDSNRGIKALQAHALPLGYVAMVPEAGLEPARTQCSRDFKSLVSTIPPPGLTGKISKQSKE